MCSVARGSTLGGQHAKGCDVLVELLLGGGGDAADGVVEIKARVVAGGASVDLVVDVGDVAGRR